MDNIIYPTAKLFSEDIIKKVLSENNSKEFIEEYDLNNLYSCLDKKSLIPTEKICRDCGILKPIDDYLRFKDDYYTPNCRSCVSNMRLKRHKENKC